MKYRRLGVSALTPSVIGLGTHQFGGAWGYQFTQQEVDRLLDEASALGVNLIDTAACYGPHLSEKLIGASLARSRADWIIATKFGRIWTKGHGTSCDFSVKNVSQQLEQSLRSLATDHIDLYQFHSGTNAEFNNDALWTYLDKQVIAGKIGKLGLSHMGALTNANDLYQIQQAPIYGVSVIQVVYNRLNAHAAKDILPLCLEKQLGVIARIPLAKGFLAGKYEPEATFPPDDHRSNYTTGFNRDLIEQAARIKQKEVPRGVEMSQWAISWCLAHPAVAMVIPGARNVEQLRSNAQAADQETVAVEHPLAVSMEGTRS